MSTRQTDPAMPSSTRVVIAARPEALPAEPFHYDLTPMLVRSLTWVHRNAGKVAGMRFSHYGYRELEARAHKKRVAYMVIRAGHSVTLDEVTRVLAGDLLPPRRRLVQDFTRKGGVLCEAARQFGRVGEPTSPATTASPAPA